MKSVKTPHGRTSRGYLFRGGYRREAATISCILAEIQRQAEEQKALGETGKAPGAPRLEAVALGRLEAE